ncbi:MAG: hypothetical protein JWR09_3791 [Mucilaginibacter sp.]|nr:hypothetical protein [Mucilaginibacter sp.]
MILMINKVIKTAGPREAGPGVKQTFMRGASHFFGKCLSIKSGSL